MRSLREQNVPPKSYSVSVPQTYENQTAGRQRTLSLRCKLFKAAAVPFESETHSSPDCELCHVSTVVRRITSGAGDRSFQYLLSRGSRHRVDAEMVRDIALCASGLLNRDLGGPSVYPPAPDFLFLPPASYGPKQWNLSTAGQQYRRSVYVHGYRSVPYPALQVFDAPQGDTACVRRQRSNTPLQALVMLNEPQFVECGRAMASRVLDESDQSDIERLQYAYRLCVSRRATPGELTILKKTSRPAT